MISVDEERVLEVALALTRAVHLKPEFALDHLQSRRQVMGLGCSLSRVFNKLVGCLRHTI